MPIFYLHLFNGTGAIPDEEGKELPDLEAARALALASIRDIVSAEASEGQIDLRGRIEIADETGNTRAKISFSSAIVIHGQESQE
jgi:hypothetical protein